VFRRCDRVDDVDSEAGKGRHDACAGRSLLARLVLVTGTEMTGAIRTGVRHVGHLAHRPLVALCQRVLARQQDPADDQDADADGRDGDQDTGAGRLPGSPVAQRTEQLGAVARRHHQRARGRHAGHRDVTATRDRNRKYSDFTRTFATLV